MNGGLFCCIRRCHIHFRRLLVGVRVNNVKLSAASVPAQGASAMVSRRSLVDQAQAHPRGTGGVGGAASTQVRALLFPVLCECVEAEGLVVDGMLDGMVSEFPLGPTFTPHNTTKFATKTFIPLVQAGAAYHDNGGVVSVDAMDAGAEAEAEADGKALLEDDGATGTVEVDDSVPYIFDLKYIQNLLSI